MTQFKSNTDKEYPCTQCGESSSTVVRQDPAGLNPRLKCGSCGFMFNGQDSLAAANAGAIKPSSPESLAAADEPEVERIDSPISPIGQTHTETTARRRLQAANLPQRPSHIFLSKDRTTFEVCTKSEFKQTAIKWSAKKHDCYELSKITLNVKVDVV